MKGSSYYVLEIKSSQVSHVSAIFCLPLESIFSMHQFWFPKYLFFFFFFSLNVDSSRSFTHKLLSEITGSMLLCLQAVCSLLHQGKSPETQIVSHWKLGHFRIHFCIHGPCHLPVVFALPLLLSQCCCAGAGADLVVSSCVFQGVEVILLIRWEALDCWTWFGCGADPVSLHVLHIRPVSGCAPGSCGTLSMAKSPRGSCQQQHFQKLHEHLKANRDSKCAHFWVYNSLSRSDWERE